MPPDPSTPPQWTAAEFTIKGGHFQMSTRVNVPAGPTTVGDLLPLARALSDAVVRQTCQTLAREGQPVSCAKGCAACCRHLIAVSEVEARRLRAVIEELPGPRRTAVRARFADALMRLDRAGLLADLREAEDWTESEYNALVASYFRQKVACPFLEDEACSVYDERPIACREHLVTSPPENCTRPESTTVAKVRLPLAVFQAVARWQVPPENRLLGRWVPLVLAPEWAGAHPGDPPPKPGPEVLRDLIGHLQD